MNKNFLSFRILIFVFVQFSIFVDKSHSCENELNSVHVLIDPFSEGALILDEMLKRDLPFVVLLSDPDKLFYHENVRLIKREEISKFKLLSVIPGTESAVDFANQLSQNANITNTEAGIRELRSKLMQQIVLASADLKHTKQKVSLRFGDAIPFLSSMFEKEKKVVVKPLSSAGSDHVYIVSSMEEAFTAFKIVAKSKTIFGELNYKVLFEEYHEGPQFMADVLTTNGVHKLAYAWQYHYDGYKEFPFALDRVDLLSLSNPLLDQVIPYAKAVVDAFKVKNGAAHIEIRLTSEGPVLIEAGVRIGGGMSTISAAATDVNIVSDYVDIFTDSKKSSRDYTQTKQARVIVVQNRIAGAQMSETAFSKLRGLKSFLEMKWNYKAGEAMILTTNLLEMQGRIHLVHADQTQIEKDSKQIREWEKQGLFRLSVSAE